RRGTTTSTYHADALGSTRALTDNFGNVTDTYLNDAWGNSVASTGTTVNPFRWVGKYGYYTDNGTGQVYVRARMYHSRPWQGGVVWIPHSFIQQRGDSPMSHLPQRYQWTRQDYCSLQLTVLVLACFVKGSSGIMFVSTIIHCHAIAVGNWYHPATVQRLER
ncbi:MAG: hypothetical protein WCK86_19600, partial [Planctomycetia bacterium]